MINMKAKLIITLIVILLLCYGIVSCNGLPSQNHALFVGSSENQSEPIYDFENPPEPVVLAPSVLEPAFNNCREIAASTLPPEIVDKAHINYGMSSATGPDIISVSFRGLRVTQGLIEWQEDERTEFIQNRSPAAYRHLEVQVNMRSGEIVKKTASTIGSIFDYNEFPDAVVPTAGGLKYEVDVNEEKFDSRSRQHIETETISLGRDVSVTYRPNIESMESRTRREQESRNIIHVEAPDKDLQSLKLNLKNVPADIDVYLPCPQDKYYEYQAWYGSDSADLVLLIEVYNIGQFSFDIGIEIEGKECGTIPCIIKILEPTNTPATTPETTWPGNHGILTTSIEPQSGETVTSSSSLMVRLTLDELVCMADTIIVGNVVDIFPAREVNIEPWGDKVITDVVIEVQRCLHGESESLYSAVWVRGGRIGETVIWAEDQPEFNLGECVILFLIRVPLPDTPPEGIEPEDYYGVTGSIQGKFGYIDGNAISPGGASFSISEVEQKIGLIYGDNN
jgi:hypothetical protein